MIIKGRGTDRNPPNRFAARVSIIDSDARAAYDSDDARHPKTCVRTESARSIISYNDSPDLAFERSINPYRVITP